MHECVFGKMIKTVGVREIMSEREKETVTDKHTQRGKERDSGRQTDR